MMYGTDEVALVRQTTDSQQLVTRRCVGIARLRSPFVFCFAWIIFFCYLLALGPNFLLSFIYFPFILFLFLFFFTAGFETTEL